MLSLASCRRCIPCNVLLFLKYNDGASNVVAHSSDTVRIYTLPSLTGTPHSLLLQSEFAVVTVIYRVMHHGLPPHEPAALYPVDDHAVRATKSHQEPPVLETCRPHSEHEPLFQEMAELGYSDFPGYILALP